ncbi:MAG TPA: TolC family protein [Acidobacteriaceae bacterium]
MTSTLHSIRLIRIALLITAVTLIPSQPFLLSAQEAIARPASAPLHLTLPAAVDMAIAHSHKLELARLSIRHSEEQKRIAESHFYPVLQNQSAVHHITELEGVIIPAGAFAHGASTGLIPSQALHIDQGASTSYTSGTALEQPLTQYFKIHAGVQAADADLRMAKIQAGDAEHAIALQVHQLYFNYLIEKLNQASAEDAVQAATTTEEESRQAVQEGKLLTDAELTVRADLLDKRRAVLISRLTLDDLTLQLDDLLGLPLGAKLELDSESFGDRPTLPAREAAIEATSQKSPSVLTALESVAKAQAGVSAARDAYIPNITGLARYSYQSGLPFFQHNFGTFGFSVNYDLFDGGAREANLRDARIKLSMAQTQLAQTQNDVRIEISSAYDKVEQLEELVQVSQLTLEAREESYRIQTQRVKVNAELASGVATAHAAVTTARRNLLSSQLSLYLAQASIQRQLGELPK